ncbi:MAG: carbamoyltransferase HypF [Ignavibacteria bacterium]|nr:carbamoyltransferase HypF [Ignavibacteria bacterium]
MSLKKYKIHITGAVQGVGFRPFIYNLANSLNIKGTVLNSTKGVIIEAFEDDAVIKNFIIKIKTDKPPISFIKKIKISSESTDFIPDKFEIIHSDSEGNPSAYILPDIAVCKDCLEEIFNPSDRRYLYPFTNCTNCGPRYTIIEKLPYDRQNTTMKKFIMCDECKNEYENPSDRRFHAQPNACPVCGPKVTLWTKSGKEISAGKEALIIASEKILNGNVVAVKGLGGFHLFANALDDDAVELIRERKNREEKPFAMMFKDLKMVEKYCLAGEPELKSLTSVSAPIVLLKKKSAAGISDKINGINSGNPFYGVLLPYTPLHHILMNYLNVPVIATSGNISDEPICIDEYEALERLQNIADYFLVHNRPILRYVDDSIVKFVMNEEMLLRRSRGYAPLPLITEINSAADMLSAGAHLKNTFAVKKKEEIFISQHIGDLDNLQSVNAFAKTIDDLLRIYKVKPVKISCDMHPDYESAKYAEQYRKDNVALNKVQHHVAHIFSCKVENNIELPFLGVAWDGTGYGTDGNIWGSEFFTVDEIGIKRIAHLKYFRLPGGEEAIKKVYRIASSLLFESGDFDELKNIFNVTVKNSLSNEFELIKNMLARNINSPLTSSMGRLFDAVSALLNIKTESRFEGQAAMELEFAIGGISTEKYYGFVIAEENEKYIVNWIPLIKAILLDLKKQISVPEISAKFHNTLTEIILDISKRTGLKKVALSGGCFQNSYLLERTIKKLRVHSFEPCWQKKIPVNDGGISLGQIAFTEYIAGADNDLNFYTHS